MVAAFIAAVLLAFPPLALTLRMGRIHRAGPSA